MQQFATSREGLDAIQQNGADILLMDADLTESQRERNDGDGSRRRQDGGDTRGAFGWRPVRKSAPRQWIWEPNDAISKPLGTQGSCWRECVRACACKRVENELRDKMRIAEEGQQIAHTAFEALAVTEKMTSDAFSLDRKLKTGFAAVFAIAILMAGIYFLFARSAQKVTQRSNSILTKLEGGILRQQDLMAEARKLRAPARACRCDPRREKTI